ncbi:MAG TPA: histidine kinase N-terminal 7TM domain-containing protein, partial [Ktedonobacteraceae bacterium]|nr:histidine kinase N-terminal 7TM domain-containing protein [Ktedonobacteraceae bacterium]
MHWQLIPDLFLTVASAVIFFALASIAWRRRFASGAAPFSLLMLALAVWSLGYALELASTTLSFALFWDNVAWLGAVGTPALWLIFTLRYTGRAQWLARQKLALLAVVPLVMLLLFWSNGFHGLIESKVQLVSNGSFSTLLVSYGTLYWVNIAYSSLLLVVGAFVICSFMLNVARSSHLFCFQGASLLVAIVAPWVVTVFMISGFIPLPILNLTPFAFLLSSLTFAESLFFFRLLDIVPVAREMVIESMKEAVIVLDAQNRIVDLNPAARRLVKSKAVHVIGQQFSQVFSPWPELVERCRNVGEADQEVIVEKHERESKEYYSFGLRISPLYHRNGRFAVTGRLIVLSDITGRVQAESALKESVGRFRNIFAEVPIGMAVVDSDGHLLQVNRAFCEMLGYSESELIGRSLAAITHPNDVAKDMLLAEQALKGEITSYRMEKRYLKKDHQTLWTDLTATILRNQYGDVVYSLVMLENIIERKRAKLLEEERHHVAYELHDGLAQVAVSAHQHLQAFANHYHPRSPQAKKELDRALDLAQRSVREARRLIAGLRPTTLDDFGLATALRLQVEALRAESWTISYD